MKPPRKIVDDCPELIAPASAHPILDQETQAFLDRFAETDDPPLHLLDRGLAQAKWAGLQSGAQGTPAVEVQSFIVSGAAADDVTVHIIRKFGETERLPIVVYLHGGGWIMGDLASHDRLTSQLAVGAGVAVVFVDYATSTAARFPVQNEQAYAAMCHVVKHAAQLRLIGDRLAVAGDGAGGNMAAVMALLSKRRNGPTILFQLLLYPVLAAPGETPSYHEFACGPWLTARAMHHYVDMQFPTESLFDAEALPGNASVIALQGLPAALIITAENDILRDEGEAYARKLIRAGVAVTATRYVGCIHDFMLLDNLADTAPASAALRQACSALRSALFE
ncbi:alpha/beta hydrolase [Pseudomonas sp. NA-150]|uniref:alpha/beta hydrolase n=1 Tax=Pseudomonas sp. NA-150 TaxID=3367525 RepID=UPI0037CCBA68